MGNYNWDADIYYDNLKRFFSWLVTFLAYLAEVITAGVYLSVANLSVRVVVHSGILAVFRAASSQWWHHCMFFLFLIFLPPSSPVQAGGWALWVEQAPKRQVNGSHGAPLLEYGTQHQSVGLQAVRDDQVRPIVLHFKMSSCPSFSFRHYFSLPQVLPPADVKAMPVGEGSFGVGRQRNGAEAEDEGGASPLLHHLRGQ